MDIFGKGRANQESLLVEFKKLPLKFTGMDNSTCTVRGKLTNVEHEESELIDLLECSGNIIEIHCNYGHIVAPQSSLATNDETKKSNRGRKKQPKKRKARKFQGDGSNFNSQVSFSILGTHIRHIPRFPDKHSKKSTKLAGDMESVTKVYKIKLFRNGRITIPGVLTESMVDVKAPLDELCRYLESLFWEEVKVEGLTSVMRNYKFQLINGRLDLKVLQNYCNTHFQKLLNVRVNDIIDFLLNPLLLGDTSPMYEGWNMFIEEDDNANRPLVIDFRGMYDYLKNSTNSKNVYVDFEKLKDRIQKSNIIEAYRQLIQISKYTYRRINNTVLQRILYYWQAKFFGDLEKFLVKSKENMLSHFKYDPEKYPGFIIKIKSPLEGEPNKKTTIKIFPSGKINIDGANNREEADFIYYWLNNLLHLQENIVYFPNEKTYEEPDEDFSSCSEDED